MSGATSRYQRTTAPSRSAARSTTLTLDDLRAMPSVERVVTLECAGNGRLGQTPLPVGEPWGSYAVSTARWTGALLHEVPEVPPRNRLGYGNNAIEVIYIDVR
jgi:DMSO/TMAO reductase YedYZ molybdopterin-dependent catalytic subunit